MKRGYKNEKERGFFFFNSRCRDLIAARPRVSIVRINLFTWRVGRAVIFGHWGILRVLIFYLGILINYYKFNNEIVKGVKIDF